MALVYLLALSLPPTAMIFFSRKRYSWLESLPSILWFFYMSLPFFFLNLYLESKILKLQFVGIFLVSISFAISDFIGHRFQQTRIEVEESPAIYLRIKLILASVFLFLIPVFHIVVTDVIPFQLLISGNYAGFDLNDARQSFTKGAVFPFWLEILLAWYIPLIASISVYILKLTLGKKVAVVAIVYVSIYSILGLEKFPLILFVFSLVLGLLYASKRVVTLEKIFVIFLVLFAIISNFYAQKYVNDVKNDSSFVTSQEFLESDLDGLITPSDTYRLETRAKSNIPAPILGFVYRTVLTPVDVSFRWYQYYSSSMMPKRNLLDVVLRKESPKATNIVGRWAYTNRFPNKYTNYIDAYTSLDADSYSFSGTLGTVYLCLLLLLLRIVLVKLKNTNNFSKFLYGISISYLSIMSFSSGLISMLFSRGMLLIFLFMMFERFWFFHRKSLKRYL